MNETANDPLKNIFIKYLDTALNRTKDRFVKQMEKTGEIRNCIARGRIAL